MIPCVHLQRVSSNKHKTCPCKLCEHSYFIVLLEILLVSVRILLILMDLLAGLKTNPCKLFALSKSYQGQLSVLHSLLYFHNPLVRRVHGTNILFLFFK